MVMDQIITDEQVLTATNTDTLAGTQLDQPGVQGVYTIFACSDVADSTITVSLGGRVVTNAAVMVERTNSEIRENEDAFFQVLSRTGGRPVISVAETTAANMRVRVRFLPAVRT